MMQQGAMILGNGARFAEGRWLVVYRRARQRARLARLVARITGRGVRLQHLASALNGQPLVASHSAGLRAVRLESIRGSEGRCEDFDRAFRPTSERTRERWMRVALAHLRGITLPPVDLVQVGEVYFVRDGHHRVSVARAFGQQSIDAQVTVWQLAEARSAMSRTAEALLGAV
jgi:hypothetical protein